MVAFARTARVQMRRVDQAQPRTTASRMNSTLAGRLRQTVGAQAHARDLAVAQPDGPSHG